MPRPFWMAFASLMLLGTPVGADETASNAFKLTKISCTANFDPKNQGMIVECMTEQQLCFNDCDSDFYLRAGLCAMKGFTPAAAICHGENTVIYAGCLKACREL